MHKASNSFSFLDCPVPRAVGVHKCQTKVVFDPRCVQTVRHKLQLFAQKPKAEQVAALQLALTCTEKAVCSPAWMPSCSWKQFLTLHKHLILSQLKKTQTKGTPVSKRRSHNHIRKDKYVHKILKGDCPPQRLQHHHWNIRGSRKSWSSFPLP